MNAYIVGKEAIWIRSEILHSTLDNVDPWDRAADWMDILFSVISKEEKKPMIDLLQNFLAAKSPMLKIWFGIGYIGALAKFLRLKALNTQSNAWQRNLIWAAMNPLITTHLKAAIGHILKTASPKTPAEGPLNLQTLNEWGKTVYDRLADETL